MSFIAYSIEPRAVYNRQHYALHKSEIADRQKEYRAKNLSKVRAWSRKSYRKHHAKNIALRRAQWKTLTPVQRQKRRSYVRRSHFKTRYGITIERRAELLAKQVCCPICGSKNPGGRGWVIDHCHATEKIRGVLCQTCNTAIGAFKDDPKICEAAAHYLRTASLELTP
jgi:hypothetical protein